MFSSIPEQIPALVKYIAYKAPRANWTPSLEEIKKCNCLKNMHLNLHRQQVLFKTVSWYLCYGVVQKNISKSCSIQEAIVKKKVLKIELRKSEASCFCWVNKSAREQTTEFKYSDFRFEIKTKKLKSFRRYLISSRLEKFAALPKIKIRKMVHFHFPGLPDFSGSCYTKWPHATYTKRP
jgi:hypothetical protein